MTEEERRAYLRLAWQSYRINLFLNALKIFRQLKELRGVKAVAMRLWRTGDRQLAFQAISGLGVTTLLRRFAKYCTKHGEVCLARAIRAELGEAMTAQELSKLGESYFERGCLHAAWSAYEAASDDAGITAVCKELCRRGDAGRLTCIRKILGECLSPDELAALGAEVDRNGHSRLAAILFIQAGYRDTAREIAARFRLARSYESARSIYQLLEDRAGLVSTGIGMVESGDIHGALHAFIEAKATRHMRVTGTRLLKAGNLRGAYAAFRALCATDQLIPLGYQLIEANELGCAQEAFELANHTEGIRAVADAQVSDNNPERAYTLYLLAERMSS